MVALNIKNREVERLAAEVARMAQETKTEAIRKALIDRKQRLRSQGALSKHERLRQFLENDVWPRVPPDVLGKALTKEEEEEILGFGPSGA